MNPITQENINVFEGYIKEMMEAYEATGIAVSIIEKNGSTIYENYFGTRNEEKNLPIDENTIFGLASITKSFTSLAIMQLYEKGIININEPVKKYIPEFTNKNQDTVLVWHLMTHSAGFYPQKRILVGDIAKELGLTEQDGDFAYNEKIAEEGIKLVAQRLDGEKEFTGKPGEYCSYSNDSFALLSDIIRRYGGEKSYGEYLNKHILAPLGMERSSCEFIKPRDGENTSLLYYIENDEKISTNDFYDNAFVLMGGGAMKSTIKDMKKYIAMYLNKGQGLNKESIVSENSVTDMTMPRIYFRRGTQYGYGLSMFDIGDMHITEHGGSLTGVSSHMMFSHELGAGVIVLCNTSGVPVSLIAKAAMLMAKGSFPVEEQTLTEVSWNEETLAKASGEYMGKEGQRIVISKEENKPSYIISGEKKEGIAVDSAAVMIKGKMNSTPLELLEREGTVWGVRFGGRIIPRV